MSEQQPGKAIDFECVVVDATARRNRSRIIINTTIKRESNFVFWIAENRT
jgi:hypothetical protein